MGILLAELGVDSAGWAVGGLAALVLVVDRVLTILKSRGVDIPAIAEDIKDTKETTTQLRQLVKVQNEQINAMAQVIAHTDHNLRPVVYARENYDLLKELSAAVNAQTGLLEKMIDRLGK